MTILVSGSLAFDLIFNYPGRFARDILPDQLHILNVSFFVPSMRRDYGGCAGNIAYNLSQLGSKVAVAGALGADGKDYLARLQKLGVDTQCTLMVESANTALALIVTDADNNQISAFHPGAMEQAHLIEWPKGFKPTLGLVGPDSGQAMLARARQLHEARVPFVFDPGQAMPLFDGQALRGFIDQATWLAMNDYEAKVLCERTALSIEEISQRDHIQGVVVTLGAEGCEVWVKGSKTHIEGLKVPQALDPTGCGDAFRAGMLHGLSIGWSLQDASLLGNRMGGLKVAHLGGQSHAVDRSKLGL